MPRNRPKQSSERRRRREAGRYFTPPRVVQYIVRETLSPLLQDTNPTHPLRVLEPSCGEGGFLAEVFRFLWAHHRSACNAPSGTPAAHTMPDGERGQAALPAAATATSRQRLELLCNSCFGVDSDPAAVETTRQRLLELALATDDFAELRERLSTDSPVSGSPVSGSPHSGSPLQANVVWGNALLDGKAEAATRNVGDAERTTGGETDGATDRWEASTLSSSGGAPPIDWASAFPQARGLSGNVEFDAVVGNPPYVNIRLSAQSLAPSVRDHYRRRYRTAVGAYDLYVLFLERSLELLRPGGICGMIVPNKLATSDYARTCRELLLERTQLLRIIDLSAVRVFGDASVYPYILIFRKQIPAASHIVMTAALTSVGSLAGDLGATRVPQRQMSAEQGLVLGPSLDVEARVATRRLDQLATLHSGTTGFTAERLASQLEEADVAGGPGFPFIVSGNIDRYRIRHGNLRFLGRTFRDPVLPVRATCLSDGKRRLYRSQKIVVAGLSRRLEAACDRAGRALGVQVYAVECADDARWLLGLLNSKLLAFLFRLRNQAKRLSGGYLSVNKSQLGQLPIRVVDRRREPQDAARQVELCGLVERIEHLVAREAAEAERVDADSSVRRQLLELEARVDRLVYQLYRLSEPEIAQVETTVDSA